MNFEDLIEKIKQLEFHQSLLLKMVSGTKMKLYEIIIRQGLHKEEFYEFCSMCERLNNKLEEQKAEGFIYFYPLFKEFKEGLHSKLRIEEVINASLNQNFYTSLMKEFKKYL